MAKDFLTEIGETVLTFGKYNGSSIEEVAIKDRGYLDWLAENEKNAVAQTALKIYLDSEQGY